MTTTEQANRVAARLHLGVSIANDRGIEQSFVPLAKEAAAVIDALVAENEKLREALRQATKWASKGSQVEVIARAALGETKS